MVYLARAAGGVTLADLHCGTQVQRIAKTTINKMARIVRRPMRFSPRPHIRKRRLRGQRRNKDLHCFSPLVPLGARAKAAAVHGIMTMTRGKGRYALTASVY